MELNAGDLVAVELPLEGDVVDVVVLDGREDATKMSDDAVLSAVEDGVAPNGVRADMLAVPADLTCGEHRFELVLVTRLVSPRRGAVVSCGCLLADRDRGALGVVDNVVLDDPPLRPVRPDEARLVRGRWGPGTRGLRQLEAAHSDIVDMVLGRGEDASAHVNLDELRIRIGSLEVCPDRRLLVADLGVPHVARLFRVADPVGGAGPVVDCFRPKRRIRHPGKAWRFVETQSVQVDVAEMLLRRVGPRIDDPVAVDFFGEGVERTEERVRYRHFPDRAAERLPAGDAFRALDDDVLV